MQAETQSSTSFSNPASGTGGAFSGSGGGSGSGSPMPRPITADDAANETIPASEPVKNLTLSEQIAANFAALSGLLGNPDQSAGGAYPVPVSVPAPAKKSPLIWVVMAGAALAVWYFFFRKKGGENE